MKPWFALASGLLVCLCYTVFLRMSVPILQGRLSKANEGQPEFGVSGAGERSALQS